MIQFDLETNGDDYQSLLADSGRATPFPAEPFHIVDQ